MDSKLISVIVPMYNAEAYIGACLESILAQTYHNWECIVVDDGSKDSSKNIAESYSRRDSRIKILSQKNAGAGIARNKGIEISNGDYLVFVDSDDTIDSHYFDQLARHDEDVVFIDVENVSESRKSMGIERMSDFEGKDLDKLIRLQMTGSLPWGGCRKAVKSHILLDYGIRYSKNRIGEEAVYSFNILTQAKTVGFIKAPMYKYNQRETSLSQSIDEDPWGMISNLYLHNNMAISEINGGGYWNTLNSLILCACGVSIDRLAQYNTYKQYREKAYNRIERALQEIKWEKHIDFKNLDSKSRLACRLILKRQVTLLYILSKFKNKLRRWVRR